MTQHRDLDSVKGFDQKIAHYVKHRPSYTGRIIESLQKHIAFAKEAVVVDVGSGTGLSSLPFLVFGNKVFGIEPHPQMRKSADELLKTFSNFISLDGLSTQTGLPQGFADLIVVAQAFHWFEKTATYQEFRRILKEQGKLLILYNQQKAGNAFNRAYSELVSPYAASLSHLENNPEDDIFHKSGNVIAEGSLPNPIGYSEEGFIGYALSFSYMPNEQDLGYEECIKGLKSIFDDFQVEGKITIEFETLYRLWELN